MYITERIDGGAILSHYLTPIDKKDNAASLFMKGIIGSVKLYSQFIDYIDNNKAPQGVIQERTFKYLRNIDWNIINDIKLRIFVKKGFMRKYCRKEKIINYFGLRNNEISKVYSLSLKTILNKGKKNKKYN